MELIKVSTDYDCSIMLAETNDIDVKQGDSIIIQTGQGAKMGIVRSAKFTANDIKEVSSNKNIGLGKVIRKATEEDFLKQKELKQKSKEAYALCAQKIEEHKLVMKLVSVEFLIDESKAIFYFTADGRVDFRDLVRDLAHIFHIRIEMRQIGVRDEAKMLGGIGTCGKEFCCATFLCSFEPVSVKMAKEQNLALSPVKISGACGRLMCCLAYEHNTYMEMKRQCPQCGRKVKTPDGEGKIVKTDAMNSKVTVLLESGDEKSYDINKDIEVVG